MSTAFLLLACFPKYSKITKEKRKMQPFFEIFSWSLFMLAFYKSSKWTKTSVMSSSFTKIKRAPKNP